MDFVESSPLIVALRATRVAILDRSGKASSSKFQTYHGAEVLGRDATNETLT